MGGYLSKDAILGADDLPCEDVEVPEWAGTVRVRTLTGSERDAFETSFVDANGKRRAVSDVRARLAALCVVDADGQRLFSDKDVKALGRKSAAALNRVVTVAQKLNAMTSDEVEELAKNSAAAPSGNGTSG